VLEPSWGLGWLLRFLYHTQLETQSLEFYQTGDQQITEPATCTIHTHTQIEHKCYLRMRSSGFETAISGNIPLDNYIRYAIIILRSKITAKREKMQRTINYNLFLWITGIKINMHLIIVLGLIAKLGSVYGNCDVGKTVQDFDFNKVSSDMLKCFLYQAVTAKFLWY